MPLKNVAKRKAKKVSTDGEERRLEFEDSDMNASESGHESQHERGRRKKKGIGKRPAAFSPQQRRSAW